MKIILWNTQWAPPGSERERMIREIVLGSSSDLVCIIEGYRQTWEDHGYLVCSQTDYGYPKKPGRRKVLLLSRTPWSEIDDLGHSRLPPGRFVSGVTDGVRFVGVCIPWRDAHVKSGRRDRAPWEDHRSYCRGLKYVLARYALGHLPICIVGDFNQRIPRTVQPIEVAKALADAIPVNYEIATEGLEDDEGGALIDHFVVSPDISISITQIIPRTSPDGTKLSDHVGVAAFLSGGNSH